MPDLLTLGPGVEVVRPDDGTRLRYSGDEVELVRNFFSLLVFGQNEWAGQPFVQFTVDGEEKEIQGMEAVHLPASVVHALRADTNSRMLLIQKGER